MTSVWEKTIYVYHLYVDIIKICYSNTSDIFLKEPILHTIIVYHLSDSIIKYQVMSSYAVAVV